MSDSDKMVIVGSYSWILDAQGVQMLLDAEGIECQLENEQIAAADPLLANAVGGIKLLVPAGSFEQAKSILEKDAKESEERRRSQCPRCESTNIIHKKRHPLLLLLGIFTFGLLFLGMSYPYHCSDCHYKWR